MGRCTPSLRAAWSLSLGPTWCAADTVPLPPGRSPLSRNMVSHAAAMETTGQLRGQGAPPWERNSLMRNAHAPPALSQGALAEPAEQREGAAWVPGLGGSAWVRLLVEGPAWRSERTRAA